MAGFAREGADSASAPEPDGRDQSWRRTHGGGPIHSQVSTARSAGLCHRSA